MKIISAKRWSYRLKGKDAAKRMNLICSQYLDTTDHLIVSMAGVKHVSEGFAFECFGPLYLSAKHDGKRFTFNCVEDEKIRDTLVSGIHAYYSLRATDSRSTG